MPGPWHNEWQNRYPKDCREINFKSTNKKRKKKGGRNCDVFLNNEYILEIQHSPIKKKEVEERKEDWSLYGKKIIWLIDGNNFVEVSQIERNGKSCYLLWFKKKWFWESFKDCYEFVILNIDDKIFKVPIKEVKSSMIVLKNFISIDEFIEKTKDNPKNLWDTWGDSNNVNCHLTIHDKGAGNGKTFYIWEQILKNEEKTTFLIVTKVKSARNVIYNELKSQIERNIPHTKNIKDGIITNKDTDNQIVIEYTHAITNEKCVVIMGTIDSLMFCLCKNRPANSRNLFDDILNTIKSAGIKDLKLAASSGGFYWAKQYIYMNNKAEVWVDEAQDLHTGYLWALVQIMLTTGIDANFVGDRLQSIYYNENVITHSLKGLPETIDCDTIGPVNENRRIKTFDLQRGTNGIIDYKKYDSIPITLATSEELLKKLDNCWNILSSPTIIGDIGKEQSKFIEEIKKNMNQDIDEVWNQLEEVLFPEDFMFEFSQMVRNAFAVELESKLKEFWINKFKETSYIERVLKSNNKYWKDYISNPRFQVFAKLHKSEEGRGTIDTNQSAKATRIVSIHTAKGDGRKIVFCLGITERNLKKLTAGKKNIKYESLLLVAVTRAIYKNYFGLEEKNDDINKRFAEQGLSVYIPQISKSVTMDKIEEHTEDSFLKIINDVARDVKAQILENKSHSSSVDYNEHIIRNSAELFVWNQTIFGTFYDREGKDPTKTIINKSSSFQTIATMKDIMKQRREKGFSSIESHSPAKYYEKLNWYQYGWTKSRYWDHFPLLKFDKRNNQIYTLYHKKLEDILKNIFHNSLSSMRWMDFDDPLTIATFVHCLEVLKQGRFASINCDDLYNLAHYLENNNNIAEFHNTLTNSIPKCIKVICREIQTISSHTQWNFHKHVALHTNNNSVNFKINQHSMSLIGYSETHVFHIYLKPNVSSLNINEVMGKILLERFLIRNPNAGSESSRNDDFKKYNGKQIITYLSCIEHDKFYKIDWNDVEKNLDGKIKEELKKAMINYYKPTNKLIFFLLRNIIKKEKEERLAGKKSTFKLFEEAQNKLFEESFNKGCPSYVKYTLQKLEDDYEEPSRKPEVVQIVTNENKFLEFINKYMVRDLDKYLNIAQEEDTNDLLAELL